MKKRDRNKDVCLPKCKENQKNSKKHLGINRKQMKLNNLYIQFYSEKV